MIMMTILAASAALQIDDEVCYPGVARHYLTLEDAEAEHSGNGLFEDANFPTERSSLYAEDLKDS